MKTAILAEAHRLGFLLAGVTTPNPAPHFDVFAAWLQSGRHGEMAYLASERSLARRADPRQVLPECRSILVLGAPYPGGDGSSPPSANGRIAAYAWNDDYHAVLVVRLQALVAFIETLAGHPVPNRWYTDSGPVLERDLAQRAGLGWIGKNTCLINPRLGSYFLLAEILLGLELEPDLPMLADHCGSCRRCIEACPTTCILPDRTLDAQRCIAYLTIELKGPIPLELRPLMGDWVFGCDICQQVCPWNRFAVQAQDMPPVTAPFSDLGLTPQAFNRKFKSNPIRRSKRRGYLRNLAVAAGNQAMISIGGKCILVLESLLIRALDSDPEALVRAHAAWALGQINTFQTRRALESALEQENDAQVLAEIDLALKQ